MFSEKNMMELSTGDDISTDEIKQRLSYMGYERTAMIEGRGEFSLRGGILGYIHAGAVNFPSG